MADMRRVILTVLTFRKNRLNKKACTANGVRRRPLKLLTQSQFFDKSAVSFKVCALVILEHFSPLPNNF